MAVVIYRYTEDTSEHAPVGVVKDGEYYGDEQVGREFKHQNLAAENAEQRIVDEIDGRWLNAVETEDSEVEIDDFR
jgi:hypothetical protein